MCRPRSASCFCCRPPGAFFVAVVPGARFCLLSRCEGAFCLFLSLRSPASKSYAVKKACTAQKRGEVGGGGGGSPPPICKQKFSCRSKLARLKKAGGSQLPDNCPQNARMVGFKDTGLKQACTAAPRQLHCHTMLASWVSQRLICSAANLHGLSAQLCLFLLKASFFKCFLCLSLFISYPYF